MRKILKGLQVADFVHPDEAQNRANVMNNEPLQKMIGTAAEMCNEIVDPLIQGTFVQVDDSSAPELSRIVKNVCAILEVEPVPPISICHLMSTNITPIGTTTPYLVVPDYVLRYSDEDMLYYNIGNSIAMIKANHVELTTLASYLPGNLFIDIPKTLFIACLHSADATSDRGGLLACQSFAAAVRNQMWELGIPPSESKKLFTTDDEAEDFVRDYLARYDAVIKKYDSIPMQAARKYQRLAYIEAPGNLMLRALFDWYTDPNGYEYVLRLRAERELKN